MGFLDELFGNSKYLNKKEEKPPVPDNWNKFIYEVCDKEPDELSEIQRAAVLCFRYDSEMQSGGYCAFFDMYPEITFDMLLPAIELIGHEKIADNYRKALAEKGLYDEDDEADGDGYETVDFEYYDIEPSLGDLLMKFVENNKEEIFRGIL